MEDDRCAGIQERYDALPYRTALYCGRDQAILQRTKYRIVQDPASADAVLHGEVLSIETNPVLFNATTGQVTTMLVTVHTKVELVDNQSQKTAYQNNDMVFRDEYQISSDVQSFFEEQDPALERMSRDFAAQLVSNVTENF